MVQAEPEGEPRIVTYEFRYEISNDSIERAMDEEGVEPPKGWKISFDLRDLPTQDLRRRARAIKAVWANTPGYPVLDRPTDDPVRFIDAADRWIADATMTLDGEESAQRRSAELANAFEQEKESWVEQHGSARLRRANKRGYKVNRLYAQERVRSEFPRYWLDTSGEAVWNERTDPSELSLDLEDAVREEVASRAGALEVRIVWLTYPPPELASRWEVPELEWAEQEAILIQPYLGRYRLFLPVDQDLWKPLDEEEEED